jgi:hypothetical protein
MLKQKQHELFAPPILRSEASLAAVCGAIIRDHALLTTAERQLLRAVRVLPTNEVSEVRRQIEAGADPLGEAFAQIRSAQERRGLGAVYTPPPIVSSMVGWLARQDRPKRIVDPGAGSGRFTLEAARRFPKAQLIAVEMDPLAALMLRANLTVGGHVKRATVLVQDFRMLALPECEGPTAFIGNPPYVRHHDIGDRWKAWYASHFKRVGIKASALAGLHLHFFLKTRLLARPGDIGAFITSSEWLDVNYGSALRELLLQDLGGWAIHVLEPSVEAFPGTAATAAITCFKVGQKVQRIRIRSVETLGALNGLTRGRHVASEALRGESRWSVIIRPSGRARTNGPELGEFFRVHRGQVTGANAVWIASDHARALPSRSKLPAVTKAKDLLAAGSHLNSTETLRRVIDLPVDLDEFTADERRAIDTFLAWAKNVGAHAGYVAQHRKAWWAVGLKNPAPILCTYMARRPPQFTLNTCEARHINVAHGLYPVEPLPEVYLARLVDWLNDNIGVGSGRTYAGGLTKFEPKEIERLRIPPQEALLT